MGHLGRVALPFRGWEELMAEAFLIVAIILFVIDAVVWWTAQASTYGGRLTSLGLAFFAASFLSFIGSR